MMEKLVATVVRAASKLTHPEAIDEIFRKINADLFEGRRVLLRCLMAAKARIGLVLSNGQMLEGSLERVEEDKIRVITGEKKNGCEGTYTDTWLSFLAAVRFEIPGRYDELKFDGYHQPQRRRWDKMPLDNVESALYHDTFDLLDYLLEGKSQMNVPTLKVGIIGNNIFEGTLELVDSQRVVMVLSGNAGEGNSVYLDVHPLMVNSVRFIIGSSGWPYDPLVGC